MSLSICFTTLYDTILFLFFHFSVNIRYIEVIIEL